MLRRLSRKSFSPSSVSAQVAMGRVVLVPAAQDPAELVQVAMGQAVLIRVEDLADERSHMPWRPPAR